ncbi:MAG: dioxygenase [Alphaproteobacteria bacterium]|nr:MAG: dioxygenase [Alphaproteobacteria bacterium]
MVHLTGIDHTLIGVRDLDSARAVWQGLGFAVSPRGRHIGWGTANYCIMLEEGYVELLGIVDPSQFTNNLDKVLESREGMFALAFASDDADRLAQELAAAGLHPDGPKDLKRYLELPDGDVLPAFKLLHLPPQETPELRAFICQHLTPDLIRRPEWLSHANGARRLVAVTICSDRPADAGFGYLPLFGEESLVAGDGEVDVATPSGTLRFMSPQWLKRRYGGAGEIPAVPNPWPAAMTIAVDDLDRAAGVLARRGVAFHSGESNLVIPAAAATGTILELVASAE